MSATVAVVSLYSEQFGQKSPINPTNISSIIIVDTNKYKFNKLTKKKSPIHILAFLVSLPFGLFLTKILENLFNRRGNPLLITALLTAQPSTMADPSPFTSLWGKAGVSYQSQVTNKAIVRCHRAEWSISNFCELGLGTKGEVFLDSRW